MKKYTVKEEAIDRFFGGLSNEEIDQAQAEGLDEDEIERLAAGWGVTVDEVMEDLEEKPSTWYAVMPDSDDSDWGYGSYRFTEALEMVRDQQTCGHPDAYIAVIDESGNEPMCVEEIHPDFSREAAHWICRTRKETVHGWEGEVDRFETKEEAEEYGKAFVRLIGIEDKAREYEVYRECTDYSRRIDFYAGDGVNYLYGEVDGEELYAECDIPEGCSDDYGYMALKHDIEKQAQRLGITDIFFQYDGQEKCLAEDASAKCEVRRR